MNSGIFQDNFFFASTNLFEKNKMYLAGKSKLKNSLVVKALSPVLCGSRCGMNDKNTDVKLQSKWFRVPCTKGKFLNHHEGTYKEQI